MTGRLQADNGPRSSARVGAMNRGRGSHRACLGADQFRPRRAGAGDRPAARHRRNPDAGMDEPRRRPGEPDRRPRLLLVAVARQAVAQGRNLRTGSAAARAAPRLRRRHGAAAGRPARAWPATPGGAAAFSAPGGTAAGRSSPSRRSRRKRSIRSAASDSRSGGLAQRRAQRSGGLSAAAGRTIVPASGPSSSHRTGGWRSACCIH